jgi:hypothetical protein
MGSSMLHNLIKTKSFHFINSNFANFISKGEERSGCAQRQEEEGEVGREWEHILCRNSGTKSLSVLALLSLVRRVVS